MDICQELTLKDWIILLTYIFLGSWKAKNLIDVYAPKLANFVIRKIEERK